MPRAKDRKKIVREVVTDAPVRNALETIEGRFTSIDAAMKRRIFRSGSSGTAYGTTGLAAETNYPLTKFDLAMITTGNPVIVSFQPDIGPNTPSIFGLESFSNAAINVTFKLLRNNVIVASQRLSYTVNAAPTGLSFSLSPTHLSFQDEPPSGEHVYRIQVDKVVNNLIGLWYVHLAAFEL
jgi:hypothetical protein